jgi:hypothetical protein
MRKTLAVAVLLAGLTGLPATDAEALTIALEPSAQTVAVGDSFDVKLTLSGLPAGAAPSLGVYDIDVLFDTSILSLSGVTFGDPVLGDQLALVFGSITSATPIPVGVNLFELSLDTVAVLSTLQAGSFTLATLSFDAISLGTSALTPSIIGLGNQLGNPLVADEVVGASATAVPEPSSAILFLAGALAVHRHLRRRQTR